ncbi:MAG TPA: hypothetical protein VFQ80_12170, partial [Thermomicrobiales bacterium]|nr:hypothetical protein [Thermomicrobiales bacterium]
QYVLFEDRIHRRPLAAGSDEFSERRTVQRSRVFPGDFHFSWNTDRDALDSTWFPKPLYCRHG